MKEISVFDLMKYLKKGNAGFGLEMYVVSNRVRGCAVPDSISEYTELEVIGNIHDNPELIANLE